MIICDRLKEIREKHGMNKKEFADYLGLKYTTYNNYETGTREPASDFLILISKKFDVSIDYLFGLNDKLNYKSSNCEIDAIKVGERLKEFRKENKLTQEKLAKILNMARSALANYERGRNIIATPFLYTICTKYNISADYLLGKINNPKYLK